MAAVYTAYLFAQAKARDLWQSPLLPRAPARSRPLLAGAAALLPVAAWIQPAAVPPLAWVLGACLPGALLLVAGEADPGRTHRASPPGRREMTRGRFAWLLRAGLG